MDESRPNSMTRDTTWFMLNLNYGVATISRLLKITGLFCKRALSKRLYSAKETYNFKEPTNRSHPIPRDLNALEGQECTKEPTNRSHPIFIWGVPEESTKHDVIYIMYELVTSYMNSSRFIWMSLVPYERISSRRNSESCHTYAYESPWITCDWVTSLREENLS